MRKLKRFIAALVAMHGLISNQGLYWQGGANENLNGAEPCFTAKIAFQFADELLNQENK